MFLLQRKMAKWLEQEAWLIMELQRCQVIMAQRYLYLQISRAEEWADN